MQLSRRVSMQKPTSRTNSCPIDGLQQVDDAAEDKPVYRAMKARHSSGAITCSGVGDGGFKARGELTELILNLSLHCPHLADCTDQGLKLLRELWRQRRWGGALHRHRRHAC